MCTRVPTYVIATATRKIYTRANSATATATTWQCDTTSDVALLSVVFCVFVLLPAGEGAEVPVPVPVVPVVPVPVVLVPVVLVPGVLLTSHPSVASPLASNLLASQVNAVHVEVSEQVAHEAPTREIAEQSISQQAAPSNVSQFTPAHSIEPAPAIN